MKKMKRSGILTLAVLLLAALALFGMLGEERQDALSGAADGIFELSDGGAELPEIKDAPEEPGGAAVETPSKAPIDEDGVYDSKEDVALYIHTYGRLPSNYVTKKEAEEAGWSGGSLEKYLPGKCIGGSRFGNYEGLLPDRDGRRWTECDIGTLGRSSRGAERIVFSNDGLIYYTGDHYETFELLYGEP